VYVFFINSLSCSVSVLLYVGCCGVFWRQLLALQAARGNACIPAPSLRRVGYSGGRARFSLPWGRSNWRLWPPLSGLGAVVGTSDKDREKKSGW